MGGLLSRLRAGRRPLRVCMLGLDGAGKTTILYRLQLGTVQTTQPTIGFNVETVVFNGVSFAVWDVGGQEQIRQLWRHYVRSSEAIIFVVDSNDAGRLSEARQELHELMQYCELARPVLLVLANKQDLPAARAAPGVAAALEIDSLPGVRHRSQPVCAFTGEGLDEGMDWLRKRLREKD